MARSSLLFLVVILTTEVGLVTRFYCSYSLQSLALKSYFSASQTSNPHHAHNSAELRGPPNSQLSPDPNTFWGAP